jgi:hypothetical protein
MLIKILLISALIGTAMAIFFGKSTKENAAKGAAGGLLIALSFMIQLFFFGIMSIAGIWVVSKIL